MENDNETMVRRRRRELEISVPQLAERSGVSETAAWAWDRGKSVPKDKMISKLADILELDRDTLAASFAALRKLKRGDADTLDVGQILTETKKRLARKMGIAEGQIELIMTIKR